MPEYINPTVARARLVSKYGAAQVELWLKEATRLAAIERERLRWRGDLFGFCHEVLGFRDLIPESNALLPGYSHEALCRFVTDPTTLFKLVLMPRYSFKSHLLSIGKTLWELMKNPNQRFLFYSDVNEKAESLLDGVKNHILGKVEGSTFRERFGAWEVDPKKGVWNQQEIVIRPRTMAHIESTIETAGLETSKVMKHYDGIIFDDLVTDKNVTTYELIEKVKEVYRKSLSLLRPDGGRVLMLGTPWDFNDLYAQIQADEEERAKAHRPPIFAIFCRPAKSQEVYPFASIGLTRQFLSQQLQQQGSYIFSCLYNLSPLDEATAIFKAKDFAFYDPTQRPEGLFITASLDPIPRHEASSQGDDAALTIVGTDQQMNLYLLDAIAGRLQPDEQIDAIMRMHAKWGLKVLALEAVAFQRELRPALERRIEQERQTNPTFRFFEIKEITSRETTKINRIRALQPYHERGAIKFPGTRLELLTGVWAKLSSQMLKCKVTGTQGKDDVLDSLADHVAIHRAGSARDEAKTYPWSSAAWFEQEQRRKRWQDNDAPPWSREALPEPAFS